MGGRPARDVHRDHGSIFSSTCSNNPDFNDEKTACESNASPGVGIFTPARCTDKDGVVLASDGTGPAASRTVCEGTPTNFTFGPAELVLR